MAAGANDPETLVYRAASLDGLEVLSCANDHHFAPHLHDGYVLWLNSQAGEHYHIRNTADVLQPGAISIIEPGVIHGNRPCLAHRRHLRSFYFSEQFLSQIAAQIDGCGHAPLLPTGVLTDARLWRQAAALHEALLQPASPLAEEEGVLTLFATLFKRCDLLRGEGADKADNRRVAAAIDYFHANLSRQFTLAEVAARVDCTNYHLIRLFRETSGASPHKYLTQLRLEQARKLLADGTGIVDAALQSGFADQSHLTRQFKARFGLTPGTYRKQRLR